MIMGRMNCCKENEVEQGDGDLGEIESPSKMRCGSKESNLHCEKTPKAELMEGFVCQRPMGRQ